MPTHQLETATFVRLSAFRDRTANFEKTFAKVWPTPNRRTGDFPHGWASGRSTPGARTRCGGGMHVVWLVYTTGTDQIERNES